MNNRIVFAAAFAIGLLAVGWVGLGFIGHSALALVMTLLIGAVYVLGAWEVRQFRAATASLAGAVQDETQDKGQAPADLATWLERVPAAMRNAVRLRVEGERSALPGLALTPYLVGLLVMLGMLGTFLGMVVTFKGAVFALEGSTDLQAIRTALAAPIKGLGLSFGTSIAGVAASAMLGLLSAMSRRERVAVMRQLDARIATVLRPFSVAHQRQETFKALQQQAHALPQVAERLQTMMERIEQRGQQLDAHLQAQQAQFHSEVKTAYTDLAATVGSSLQASLAAGAKAAGESLQPVMQAAMAQMASEATAQHQRVFDATQTQLTGLANAFDGSARTVAEGWTSALQQHASTSQAQVARLGEALQAFTGEFEKRAAALLTSVEQSAAAARAEQAQADAQRLQAWTQTLHTSVASLHGDWQQASAQSLAQQQAVSQALEKTASDVMEQTSQRTGQALEQLTQLLAQSETLVRAHSEAEARWTTQQGERLDQLAALWRSELAALRNDEAARGEAAALRLGELHSTLSAQLAQDTRAVLQDTASQASQSLQQVAQLLTQSEALVQAHTAAEARWTEAQGQRLDELAALWRSELAALRNEEAARGEAAAKRLGELHTSLTAKLAQESGEVLQRASQQGSQTLEHLAQLVTEAEALVSSRTESEARWTQQQGERLDQLAQLWRSELSALRSEEAARGEAAAERLGTMQTTLTTQLAQSTSEVLERTTAQTSQTLEQVAKLVTEAGALILACTEFEEHTTTQQGERMNELAALWRIELAALREQEAKHGQAAVARLGELEGAVTKHLSTLGTALEAPMTRLMETAAAAPQAAAEVIAQLRTEMGQITARDNAALEERAGLVAQINGLLASLNEAAAQQRTAIESLVGSASAVMDQASRRFAQTLDDQADKSGEVAAQVAGSAVELASLGEAFSHGVQLFSAANEKLVDSLQRVEGAVSQSTTRSDEQLAYYVAQAREVIDLSITSQQQIVEDLRSLRKLPMVQLPTVSMPEGRAA